MYRKRPNLPKSPNRNPMFSFKAQMYLHLSTAPAWKNVCVAAIDIYGCCATKLNFDENKRGGCFSLTFLVTSSPHFLFLKTHEAKNRQLEIFFWKLEFWIFFLKNKSSGWQAAVFLSAVKLHHIVGKLSFSYQMSQVFILFVLEDRTRDGVAFLSCTSSFVFENTSGSFLPTKLLTASNRWDESYEKFNVTPIS